MLTALLAAPMTRTIKKKQEQLTLPELEPAFVLEIQGEQPVVGDNHGSADAKVEKLDKPRHSPRNQRNAMPRGRREKAQRSAETIVAPPVPEIPAITLLQLPSAQPQLTYSRQEDSLRITILAEPVLEDRSSPQLSAGYTADGRLAEIRLFNVARQILPAQATTDATADPMSASGETAELLSVIRDELLFLKAGLALVLAGVLWLLLK